MTGGHCGGQWPQQLGLFDDIFSELRWIAFSHQMLKGQKKLVSFNRCMGNLIEELRLIRRAKGYLLDCRRRRRAVWKFFVNSCHHVRMLLLGLIFELTRQEMNLFQEEDHSANEPTRYQIIVIRNPEWVQSVFRMHSNLWVQKIFG